MNQPLADLRVLDFCWIGAGALVTQMLALHGAEVIKIESRHRPDGLRLSPPHRPGTEGLDASGYFASRNAGKKSFALNMAHRDGPRIAHRLLRACSMLTSNFRPGVMTRWGLDYDQLAAGRPDLIWLSMPMQGETGPHREYAGFGSTIAALSGLVAPSGLPDRTPVGTGTHYPDHVPNPGHALVAVLAALYNRGRTGCGARIELAQFESTVNVMGPAIVANSVTGVDPVPAGNRVENRCPHGVYPCRYADTWCAISVADDAQWRATLETLGLEGLVADVGWHGVAQRKSDEDRVDHVIAEACRGFDAETLMERLQRRGVPASVVRSASDVLADGVLADREYWQLLDHPVMGRIRVASGPFVWDGRPTHVRSPAPLLGQHTEGLAAELLDIDSVEYNRLVDEGVLW